MSACPSCARPVLATGAGLLDPDASRAGLFDACGAMRTEPDIQASRAGRGPYGYHRHSCPEPAPGAGCCPRCGRAVLAVAGRVLDAAPHPLGVYRGDGALMSQGEYLARCAAGRRAGHRVHVCSRPDVPLCAETAGGGTA